MQDTPKPPSEQLGFTLIELIIAVAIIGILASIGTSSYQSYVRQSRRAEALAALLELQNQQERYRVNNTSYAATSALTLPASDYYTYSASDVASTTYTLTATAKSSQTADTGCTSLTLNQSGTKTPSSCWKK
jgi:type IV pilus assembly protein PilE